MGLLKGLATTNVKLLADLYHMNIEEVDLATAIRAAGSYVGHVHFAVSHRLPPLARDRSYPARNWVTISANSRGRSRWGE